MAPPHSTPLVETGRGRLRLGVELHRHAERPGERLEARSRRCGGCWRRRASPDARRRPQFMAKAWWNSLETAGCRTSPIFSVGERLTLPDQIGAGWRGRCAHRGQRLVHGDVGVAEAAHALEAVQRPFRKGLAEHDADVLHRMVHRQCAVSPACSLTPPGRSRRMAGEALQHVVEEADAGASPSSSPVPSRSTWTRGSASPWLSRRTSAVRWRGTWEPSAMEASKPLA